MRKKKKNQGTDLRLSQPIKTKLASLTLRIAIPMQPPSLHPPPPAAAARPRGRKGRASRRRDRTWHVTVFNNMPVPWDRDWAELPQDAISCILRKLDQVELLLGGAAAVCRSWRRVARHEPELWRCIDARDLPAVPPFGWQAVRTNLVRAALRLSAGQCEVFAAELFDDDLFLFLGEQAPLLKRLYLIKCYYVSKEVFAKVMRKFPLLEELELSMWFGSTEMLEIVAEACPRLKHFSLIKKDRFYKPEDDGNAFAIAKMHELRSLYLDSNRLTNKGLTVILDGCPHLEHLNVFECKYLRMDDDLLEKCSRVNMDGPRYSLPYLPCSCCWSPDYPNHEDYEDYREDSYYYLGDHIDDDDLAEHERLLDIKGMRRYLP
ncbi:putative F-box/LRR-repeat protein 23 [Triticum urartu]|uniref:putative F-box/LRR-repeat protein 23 n=1 Tax=Triticum urartu TaxID=4572 RepID=UPI0020449124|nr:putative F-box/LRR-repeat protein 23 [Triticum urartu]